MYKRITLLKDGREAFPALLAAIREATESIEINMFLWRDDEVGNRMAEALLAAADRGVRVTVSVDRYATLLELSEECRRSFFHKHPTLGERCGARFLARFYRAENALPPQKEVIGELYRRIASHEGITLDCDRKKADHSKFYIFDGRVLFLGGINVEDKENGADRQGRVYSDYMARLEGEDFVSTFRKKRRGEGSLPCAVGFPMNLRESGLCEMEEHYLSLIRKAEHELLIVMSYFSPLRRFTDAILDAHRRGVRVRILIPERSNFQDDSNKRTVRRLLAASQDGIEVYFSPKMLHTKLILSEAAVSFGSTNITKKAFSQLDELNLYLERCDSDLFTALTAGLRDELALARRVRTEDVTYCRIKAFLENFLV